MRYLQAKGVSRPIAAAGRGKSRPVASNATAAGRRLNRRVEIDLERSGY
jgi:outer membrane protein OmpA-like peptidoglycan-associated protein